MNKPKTTMKASASQTNPRTFAQCNRCGATATLSTSQAQLAWLSVHDCPQACKHEAGYWINQRLNNWRCYHCQYQQWTKPTKTQNVEVWRS